MTRTRKKRPCRICRRWFRPHPRAGDRQKVCSEASCQRERHRLSCAAWHAREREESRCHRLRQKIIKPLDAPSEAVQGPVRGRVAWDEVRDAVGVEVAVITEVIAELFESVLRDAVESQVLEITSESRRVPSSRRRDAIAVHRAPP